MDVNLRGKTALVTGASRGIGRAIALAFAHHGADVAVAARSADAIRQLAEEIRELGRRAHVIPADTSRPEENERLVAEVEAALGPVNILVNNAGGAGSYVEGGNEPMLDTAAGAALRLFELNVVGPFTLTRAAAQSMRQCGGGSVINMSSRLAFHPNPSVGVYSAAKAAVQSLTASWALELGPHGIRVNAIAPGGVATANMSRILDDPELRCSYEQTVPLGRLGTPRDAAHCALFLASDAAGWISGATILVSEGRP